MGTSSSEDDQYVRTKLSTLWTVQSLNIVATDVLSSLIPGWREELERFAGGKENVKWYMLAGTLIYEIPISMIYFSRYLDRDVNRWANVGAAGVTAALLVGGGKEPHYIVMATIEVITLAYIAWTALQWESPSKTQASAPARVESPAAGLRLLADPITGACGLGYSFRF
ncbi:MAG TPA: DUF6326 family protein [Fibrobacteria bacterium]|nr:DUF6326 family protein [Fibrobacteria bacterium]